MRLFPLTLLLLLVGCSRGCSSTAIKNSENATASEDEDLEGDKSLSPRPIVNDTTAEDQAAPAD